MRVRVCVVTFGGEAEVLVETSAAVISIETVAWHSSAREFGLDRKRHGGLPGTRETWKWGDGYRQRWISRGDRTAPRAGVWSFQCR